MEAAINLDVPEWQIGQEASVYFPDSMVVHGKYEELPKKQVKRHWIILRDCANSGVYCSECHTKVFENYPFKKKLSYFCPHCGTMMESEKQL